MAKKDAVTFVCEACGYESPKWLGQCICGAWNSFYEQRPLKRDVRDIHSLTQGGREGGSRPKARPLPVSQVKREKESRLDTGIGELNRVLGGGLMKGSLTLLSGEPGIGKSTVILQAAASIASRYGKTLYVSGEESAEQIRMRCDRVCPQVTDDLLLLAETRLEEILAVVQELEPVFLIVDSIQTLYAAEADAAPGSVSQVRLCGSLLMNLGKSLNLPIFLVAHVTKSGELAGPKILEHLVDTVLQFTGDRYRDLRLLRAMKNRFGTTQEIGAFSMEERGMVEIDNLSGSLLEGFDDGGEGTAATAVYEGTRPLLLEIQALTAPTPMGFPRRSAVGIDNARLHMIIAVLEKRAGLSLINKDVYVNVVGGLRPEGTSWDLAAALAIYSSERGLTVPGDLLVLGEIGLTGHLRPVQHGDKLIAEGVRMGFTRLLLPEQNARRAKTSGGVELLGVPSLARAIACLEDLAPEGNQEKGSLPRRP